MLTTNAETATNAIRDFGAATVMAVTTLGAVIAAAVTGWRRIKTLVLQNQTAQEDAAAKVSDSTVKAAEVLASATSAQIEQVQQTIRRTVGTSDGDGTLRSIVESHGEALKHHANQFDEFRRETLDTMNGVDAKLGLLNDTLMRFLLAKATDAQR